MIWTIAAAFAFTLGGICMKSSAGMTRLTPTLLLYLFFAAGATLQTLALRRADLGVAYLFVLGLEAVLAFVFGVAFFAETVSLVEDHGGGGHRGRHPPATRRRQGRPDETAQPQPSRPSQFGLGDTL